MLKKEIRALDRLTKREQSINYEYLRNVIVEYLSSTQPMVIPLICLTRYLSCLTISFPQQQQTLANVITTLLECNQAELERIRNSGGKKLVAPNSPQQQTQSSLFSRASLLLLPDSLSFPLTNYLYPNNSSTCRCSRAEIGHHDS